MFKDPSINREETGNELAMLTVLLLAGLNIQGIFLKMVVSPERLLQSSIFHSAPAASV